MVFSSLIFLFSFLPFILVGNFIWKNNRWQNILLFLGSLYFYAWGEKEKVFIMIGSILVNFIVGKLVDSENKEIRRKTFLAIGIIVNLGVLLFFKYSEFLVENINLILSIISVNEIKVLRYEKLPIGISFYTFQSISYLIDVYRREVKAQKNFINLGLYIALFPQLIAGPIVRYQEIHDQLKNRIQSLKKFESGVKRFIIGLAKKMLLANPIAFVVDEILILPPDQLSTGLAWVAIAGYSLQIYFDFSGYSDMAIGLGKMFGFDFPENFRFPYIAKSIREFWTRWHITLSVWFRDYLYISLGGNRKNKFFTYRNLIIVFFITGLWHGASWNFILWGLYHGFFMIIERIGFSKILKSLPSFIQHGYTILVVAIGWSLFRIEDFEQLISFEKVLFGSQLNTGVEISEMTGVYFWLIFAIACFAAIPFSSRGQKILQKESLTPAINLMYLVLFIFTVLDLTNSTYNPFIYFRF
jgi:alginate O-acetyltransferase complex protein AlgI